jgi:hypothetical protein
VDTEITLVLHIKVAPWLESRNWRWIRLWSHTPERAACVVQDHKGFSWTCYGPFGDDIGHGLETSLEEAKKMADATLQNYCKAHEVK